MTMRIAPLISMHRYYFDCITRYVRNVTQFPSELEGRFIGYSRDAANRPIDLNTLVSFRLYYSSGVYVCAHQIFKDEMGDTCKLFT